MNTNQVAMYVLYIAILPTLVLSQANNGASSDRRIQRLIKLGLLQPETVVVTGAELTENQQCSACVAPPGYNGCFEYDPRRAAATLEEAIANFPDPTNVELEVGEKPPKGGRKRDVKCKTDECRGCKAFMLNSKKDVFRRMGGDMDDLYDKLGVTPEDETRYECKGLRMAREKRPANTDRGNGNNGNNGSGRRNGGINGGNGNNHVTPLPPLPTTPDSSADGGSLRRPSSRLGNILRNLQAHGANVSSIAQLARQGLRATPNGSISFAGFRRKLPGSGNVVPSPQQPPQPTSATLNLAGLRHVPSTPGTSGGQRPGNSGGQRPGNSGGQIPGNSGGQRSENSGSQRPRNSGGSRPNGRPSPSTPFFGSGNVDGSHPVLPFVEDLLSTGIREGGALINSQFTPSPSVGETSKSEETPSRGNNGRKVGHNPTTTDFRSRSKRSTTEGTVYPMYTVARGEVDSNSQVADLCGLQWQWRVLPEYYFPRYLNELSCTSDRRCLAGYGQCQPRHSSIAVLKNMNPGGVPDWRGYNILTDTCCDCRVAVDSPLYSWVKA